MNKDIDNIFQYKLQELALKIGKSYNSIERDLGYPRNALNNYKNGGVPSGQRLIELSEYFGVSPGYFFGVDDSIFEKREVAKIFNSLKFEEKCELFIICENWKLSYLEAEQNRKLL
jgi:transcriptional regulator with XRE-family HTH domain